MISQGARSHFPSQRAVSPMTLSGPDGSEMAVVTDIYLDDSTLGSLPALGKCSVKLAHLEKQPFWLISNTLEGDF